MGQVLFSLIISSSPSLNIKMDDKLSNDYNGNANIGKGIKFGKNADGSNFTFRPILSENLLQITNSDRMGVAQFYSDGRFSSSKIGETDHSIGRLSSWIPSISGRINNTSSDALEINYTNAFADVNKPAFVGKDFSKNLPSDFHYGIKQVFILETGNAVVLLLGRGNSASDAKGLYPKAYIATYVNNYGWQFWYSLL